MSLQTNCQNNWDRQHSHPQLGFFWVALNQFAHEPAHSGHVTARKTKMTMDKKHHLKMYLLYNMIFRAAMLPCGKLT